MIDITSTLMIEKADACHQVQIEAGVKINYSNTAACFYEHLCSVHAFHFHLWTTSLTMVSLSLRRSLLWVVVIAAAVSTSSAKRVTSSAPLTPFGSKSSSNNKLARMPSTTTAAAASSLTSNTAAISTPRGGGTTLSVKFCVTAGLLLAFNSGYINGCCLKGTFVEGTKQAVAAVTGAYTTGAIALADGRLDFFKLQAKVLASYISGSAIAGALIPTPKLYDLAENTGTAFLLAGAFLFAAHYLATGKGPSSNWIFYFAAIANGITNSVTSVHTANLCRTAHYSGISSDIGTFSGQLIGGNDANAFKLKVFIALAVSFFMGGYASYFVSDAYTSSSLIFPAIFDFLIGVWLTTMGGPKGE
jgi:hypothetical protein